MYGTTDLFLVTFGLDSLHDLPEIPEEILSAKTEEVQEGVLFNGDGEILSSDTETKQEVTETTEATAATEAAASVDTQATADAQEKIDTQETTDLTGPAEDTEEKNKKENQPES